MNDIISDPYYGNIQPHVRTCKKGSHTTNPMQIQAAETMGQFMSQSL